MRFTIAVVIALASVGLIYAFLPLGPLNSTELQLVGTWKFPSSQTSDGKVIAWVLNEDRKAQLGWMQNGKLVEKLKEPTWSAAEKTFHFHSQGADLPGSFFQRLTRFIGITVGSLGTDVQTIVSLTDDKLEVRMGEKTNVLVRVKSQ